MLIVRFIVVLLVFILAPLSRLVRGKKAWALNQVYRISALRWIVSGNGVTWLEPLLRLFI